MPVRYDFWPGPWNSKRVVVDVNVSFIVLGIDQSAFVWIEHGSRVIS
jgi:hypothetical protein